MIGPLLRVENITFGYKPNSIVLNNVSIKIHPKEIVCLLGISGTGKTTLMEIILKNHLPKKGKVVYGEKLKEIAYVPQNYTLFPHLNALENVELILRCKQKFLKRIVPDNQIRGKACQYLEKVGLTDYKTFFPHELSGGQQQRISIAQAFAQHASIILMDEPFGALDENRREELQNLLIELQQTYQTSVLFVTHDLEEALYLGQRIYVLGDSGSGATITEYPVEGALVNAPEIKKSEVFFKQRQALQAFIYLKHELNIHPEKIDQALQRGLIDETILGHLEQKADEIWVVSKDLKQDLDNPVIFEAVEKNLKKGKQYFYVTPDNNEVASQNIKKLKIHFKTYINQMKFHTLPADTSIFFLGETIMYDPLTEKAQGFTYLNGVQRGSLIRLPDEFTKVHTQLLLK